MLVNKKSANQQLDESNAAIPQLGTTSTASLVTMTHSSNEITIGKVTFVVQN